MLKNTFLITFFRHKINGNRSKKISKKKTFDYRRS